MSIEGVKMNKDMAERVKKAVGHKDNVCYVLITCQQPKKDGRMQVEMTYEGDLCLAAYLIESAQGIFNEQLASSSD